MQDRRALGIAFSCLVGLAWGMAFIWLVKACTGAQ